MSATSAARMKLESEPVFTPRSSRTSNFVPFRACDASHRPEGYCQVYIESFGPVWGRLDQQLVVRLFGWGESPLIPLSLFDLEEQRRLMETLD
jgi:hypothetical protein